MKIVKVTYTTKAEYAQQNKNNIQQVMTDLQALAHPGINYNACVAPDGRTFIHTAFFKSEEDQQRLNQLPSFLHFQQQLRANGLETPPKQELLELVGTSAPVFIGG